MGKKYKGTDVLDLMSIAKNYNNFLIDLSIAKIKPESKKILDFGAGLGTYAQILSQKGFDVECVELDDSQREIILSKGIKAVEDINSYKDNSIENIVSFNVFEHIENDAEILKTVFQKLKQGGSFFFFVPACSCLYSEFDKKLGHHRRYDMDKTVEMLKSCGFIIDECKYFDSVGFILAYVYKLLNKNGKISKFSILLFDKILFPLSVLLDKICSKKFGKNIMVYLTKE